ETALDTVVYTVSDGHGGSDTATLTVTVTGSNDGPVAQADTAGATEDGAAVTIDVLANDSDVDGDALTITGIDTSGTTGSAQIVDGKVVYDPAGGFEHLGAGETALDMLVYTVSDGQAGTATATVVVTITG